MHFDAIEAAQNWCPTGDLSCCCVTNGKCTGRRPESWPTSPSAHEATLRRLPCLISGSTRVTLHHCRGGSMHMTPFGEIAMGKKQSDALMIPLHADWHIGKHRIDGPLGYSVADWEEKWKPQVELLYELGNSLGLSLWALSWDWATEKQRALIRRRLSPGLSRRLGYSSAA